MDSIRCEGIRKSFGGVSALADLWLRFPSWGITAMLGPNGAGKTTLLNILTGFDRADSGHCFIGENELTYLPPYRVARLGIGRTFQDLRLVFQVSALENILVARPNQRGEGLLQALLRSGVAVEEERNHDRALQLLRFVGLDGIAPETAGELSYGQQKLLALARCLAMDAKILLLDEPVAGVHPEIVARILRLLRHVRDEEGRVVIFIEHDIAAVREVADHIVVMDEGRIIDQGSPLEVLRRPDIMEAYLG